MNVLTVQGATKLTAIIVQQGKVLDFIDGSTQRNETPEEHVRQEIAKSLVREYRYPKSNISIEFTVQIGTRKPRADIVVFVSSNGFFFVLLLACSMSRRMQP